MHIMWGKYQLDFWEEGREGGGGGGGEHSDPSWPFQDVFDTASSVVVARGFIRTSISSTKLQGGSAIGSERVA